MDSSMNYVQGISGERYDLLVSNLDGSGYGGMYLGGEYDGSNVNGYGAHMYTDTTGFNIQNKKGNFTIYDKDLSGLFVIDINKGVALNKNKYGYNSQDTNDLVSGVVAMGLDENGNVVRNALLTKTVANNSTSISNLIDWRNAWVDPKLTQYGERIDDLSGKMVKNIQIIPFYYKKVKNRFYA